MNTCLFIRSVALDDAEEVAQLLARVVDSSVATALDPSAATVKGQRAFIESLPERAFYLAAIHADSGAIVGVQDVLPNELDPRVGDVSTFVDLERARTGIGSALTEATLARARAHEFEELHAVIQRVNESARAFYTARGFVEDLGRTPHTVVGVLALNGDGTMSQKHRLPTGSLFAATCFSFAAASVPMAYFQASGTWIMSRGFAELAYAAFWLVVILPYCVLRTRQGRSTWSWVGVRDSLLLAAVLALAFLLIDSPPLSSLEIAERLRLGILIAAPCVLGHGLLSRFVRGRSNAHVDVAALVALFCGLFLVVASRHWLEL